MAINPTRIFPDDLNRNSTMGVAFPLMEGGKFTGTLTYKEQVKSNIIHTLMTERGEIVNKPKFGVGLKNLLFEQNIDIEQLKSQIQNQFDIYIPNIELNNVEAEFIENDNLLYIKIVYEILLNGELDAVKLNFLGGAGRNVENTAINLNKAYNLPNL